jgi:S-adenosylmethionine synthetase
VRASCVPVRPEQIQPRGCQKPQLIELTPKGIIGSLDLRRPIYRETARHRHFGRELAQFTWEKTDKADALKKAAGG